MDDKLDYLLHAELEGLFDPPAAAGEGQGGAAPAALEPDAAPAAAPEDAAAALTARLHDPKVLEALVRLLGLR